MPVSGAAIEQARQRCLQIVKKRAAMSAGVAAIPLPGIDILSDATGFAVVVDEVNKEFGLTQKQIERLTPRLRRIAYEAAASVGGMMVGKMVTRGLIMRLFKRSGAKIAAKSTAKFVPLAGQLASAAIGYALFKKMGDQHVEACAKVARELEAAGKEEFGNESPMPVM
ncbi:hypothetical protein KBW98_18140 [Massilia sp. ST3]|nr:hypothetical protein [Massilia sp. ST3]